MSQLTSVVQEVTDFAMDQSYANPSPSPTILARSIEGIRSLLTGDHSTTGHEILDWDAVHEAIQQAFDPLTDRVSRIVSGVEWLTGRSSAKAFELFSYRVFPRLDGTGDDPLIVGMTCLKGDGQVRIYGDISGDETGHVYFDEDCDRTTPARMESVLSTATEVARRLASQDSILIKAIRSRPPRATS